MSPVFRHGRLRLYLLKLLDEAPRHGYEVIRLLQDRFMGVYAPSPGTIYPRLARLEEEGLVTHDEADGRKVYRITDKGREELRARLDDLTELEEEITASVRDIAREVTEDVRETVRTLREELTWAAREFQRAYQPSGGADPGGDVRHGRIDQARARAEAARAREAARAKEAAQAKEPAQAQEGAAQAKEPAQAQEGAAQAREGAGAEDVPRDREDVPGGREDVPGGREDVPGGREDVPGGEDRRGGEQAGAEAWRNAEDEWRDWHERWHSEAGEHAGHEHAGHGQAGHGHGGHGHGGRRGRGGQGRGGKEWGEWGEWAGWTGWGGWPGASGHHDWADPEAYRDLERLAKQFSRELRSAAWHAQAVSEDALRDLGDILEETIDRIKDEVFKGKTPPHRPSDPEDTPPPAG
jgi:DNA-binding PadR family transcriptional regulator